VPQATQIDGEPRLAPDSQPQHLAVRVVPRSLRVLAPAASTQALYASLES
jgi:hypothetical protein